MAQAVHSTFGCVCCADMGVKVRQLAAQAQAELKARVSTDGLDQFFGGKAPGDEIVTAEVVEVIEHVVVKSQEPLPSEQYETLLRLVNEQSAKLDEQQAKLEAASFRIGYLEGQLENYDQGRKTKLLPDYQSGLSIWNKMVSAVKSTFAWPPTPEEIADLK